MRIRQIRIVLPPGSGPLAAHDARAIAEAVGRSLGSGAAPPDGPVRLQGHGRHGQALASAVTDALPKGGRHGR